MATEEATGKTVRGEPIPRIKDGNGTFIYTITLAERDAEACRLKAEKWTYQQIADELGYHDRFHARDRIKKVLRETVQPAGDALRTMELLRLEGELRRLNGLEASVREVLERKHITVSNGRIIHVNDEPLLDDGPVLNAVDRLLKIEDARRRNGESRRKLLGLDAATKVDATVTEVTQQDIELQEMIRAAKAKAAAEEQAIIEGETP